MKELQKMVLIGEIEFQSRIALRAAERIQAAKGDMVELWSSIQLFLSSSANVSKILWPNPRKPKYASRGEELRKLLEVDENNPLFSRRFRNYLEHYDELIDDLFEDQPSAGYTDLVMNPSMFNYRWFINRGNNQSDKFIPNQRINRGYNPPDNTLFFRGKLLDLNDLINALKE